MFLIIIQCTLQYNFINKLKKKLISNINFIYFLFFIEKKFVNRKNLFILKEFWSIILNLIKNSEI